MTRHLHSLFRVIFYVLFLLPISLEAFEWPFNTDEFQKKISTKDLNASIRYFARGPSFLNGQIWNETSFLDHLKKQNYRIRDSEQILMASDAKKLNLTQCQGYLNDPNIPLGAFCWIWQTNELETFTVLVSAENIILQTYKGSRPERFWKASLDPVLVAQYRDKKPIMQKELTVSEIPVSCMNAVMAIEDSEFLDHSGLSYMGLARSLYKNVIKGYYAQGGSTITQQLVKNYFLSPEKTIQRKLKEMYLAIKLESEWNKDQILETYLNVIYMGQWGAFQVLGFGAAGTYYFNKPLQKLTLSECALLAAIVNNPARYNPWSQSENAKSRRQLVLNKMKDHKLISESEANRAAEEPLPPLNPAKSSETAPYFFEAAQNQIESLGLSGSARSIYTSLDPEAQEAAQNSLREHINQFEKSKKTLVKNKEKGFNLEGLIIASENQTGLVSVLVGGQNYKKTQFNRALQGHRQIGSLIKPFVYLSPVINGLDGQTINPETELNDEKFEWLYDKKSWSPENYDHKFHGKIPFYYALKESLNSPTAQIAQKVGLDKIIKLTHEIGFTSKMDATPATSLGASQHYATEVLEAYRTLANLGQYSKSGFIEKIGDAENKLIFEFSPKFEEKISSESTSILVGMMKETLLSGTAKAAPSLGWSKIAAGKTGTTSNNKDAWFTGFTPHQTAVVWLGYDQSISHQLTGGGGGVPIWVSFMKNYSSTWPADDFKFADSTVKREVDLFGAPNKKTELIFKK